MDCVSFSVAFLGFIERFYDIVNNWIQIRLLANSNESKMLSILIWLNAGDGVGPEICESVTTIFKEMSVPVEFETVDLNKHTLKDEGAFNMAVTSLKRNGVGLKGKS